MKARNIWRGRIQWRIAVYNSVVMFSGDDKFINEQRGIIPS